MLNARSFSHYLFLVLLVAVLACSDNQNSFVPYAKVEKYVTLPNYNNLLIPGNSTTFPTDGYAGLIVICISDMQYLAFDACCPYEGARLSIVETNPGQSGIVFKQQSGWNLQNLWIAILPSQRRLPDKRPFYPKPETIPGNGAG